MKYLILKNHFNYKFLRRIVGWHANYYLFGHGMPLSAGVYITEACNSRCIMCNIWKRTKPSTLTWPAQKQAIDALAKTGCFYYSVSGGETTLVKDIVDRMAYAARKIPYVRLVTNGLSMNKELACAFSTSGVKEISISIDGSDEYHNFMRGIENAADKAWNCLDLLYSHAPQIQLVVNSIVSPFNIDGLRELGKRLVKYPKVHQKYLPITAHDIFNNQDIKSLNIPFKAASPDEIENFLSNAVSDPRIVNSSVFLKKAALFFKGQADVIPEQKRCLYPYHAIEFDSKGCAYCCYTGMEFKNGFPAENDLESYLNSSGYRNTQKKLEGCTKCRGSMMLCYYEPRLNFPLHNLLYYMFKS